MICVQEPFTATCLLPQITRLFTELETMKKILLALLVIHLTACTHIIRPNFTTEFTSLRAGQYQLDKMHSYLLFRIDHLGLSKIVGRFNTIDASLNFDPDNPKAMELQGVIETDSIDLNNSDLESTLQEPDWFNTEQFPQLVFTSESVKAQSSGQLEITGTLTMRGITRPLVLTAVFNGGADNLITRKYTLGFSATAMLRRSDFGMDSFSAFAGDEIEVELHGEFLKE